MWFRERDGERLLVGAHIDDFIICGSSRDAVDSFRLALLNRFEGTYEGVLHHYLGCAVTRDLAAGTTFLSQAHYAEHTLKQLDMWDCTPVKTPLPPGARLSIDDCAVGYIDPEFHAKYRRIVGCLGWLVGMTRPDLSWTYASLARFVAFPGQVHMDAAVHALAYLRGTYDKGLLYCRTPGIDHNRLWGWVDADYAGCQDTRKSHTGYVLMLNGAAISWKSKRQASVSLSSAESEFIAASQCGQEIVYLREILRGFHAPPSSLPSTWIAPRRIPFQSLSCRCCRLGTSPMIAYSVLRLPRPCWPPSLGYFPGHVCPGDLFGVNSVKLFRCSALWPSDR